MKVVPDTIVVTKPKDIHLSYRIEEKYRYQHNIGNAGPISLYTLDY